MKSHVLEILDPRSVDLSALAVPVQVSEDAVEAELSRTVLPFVRWEPAERAREGDMAVCRLVSSVPRYQKQRIKLMVGSGMFSPELEAALPGMEPGQEKTLELPEGTVTVTLLEVQRRRVPTLTDEMVRSLNLDGISTVEAYRRSLRRKLREQAALEVIQEPLDRLIQAVIDGSAFVLYRQEWEVLVRQRIERSRVLFLQEGIDMEQARPEDFAGRIPVRSYYELLAMEQADGWNRLCLYLLGLHWAARDDYAPSRQAYEAFLQEYCKTWRSTGEAARAVTPYEAYAAGEYVNYAVRYLETLVLEQLMKEDV